ncbi:hypothetical protein F3Y22_tig00117034pilonHSYRG00024 [Hibiscus syriacus]|uniref:Uncharacterized protein n=1 Tax=Hibiscus syriacus TaxID=106335 RepID=A0A6A2X8Z7_HIBSY|nr:hypothetical protein F3Y22_tig00117034pilonHSYRG00024 [Hibiscus syriacus]
MDEIVEGYGDGIITVQLYIGMLKNSSKIEEEELESGEEEEDVEDDTPTIKISTENQRKNPTTMDESLNHKGKVVGTPLKVDYNNQGKIRKNLGEKNQHCPRTAGRKEGKINHYRKIRKSKSVLKESMDPGWWSNFTKNQGKNKRENQTENRLEILNHGNPETNNEEEEQNEQEQRMVEETFKTEKKHQERNFLQDWVEENNLSKDKENSKSNSKNNRGKEGCSKHFETKNKSKTTTTNGIEERVKGMNKTSQNETLSSNPTAKMLGVPSVGRPEFIRNCKNLIYDEKPDIISLLETKEKRGDCQIDVENCYSTDQAVHCESKEREKTWLTSFIYVQPRTNKKKEFWEDLSSLSDTTTNSGEWWEVSTILLL